MAEGGALRDWPCVKCGASDRYSSGDCRPCALLKEKLKHKRVRVYPKRSKEQQDKANRLRRERYARDPERRAEISYCNRKYRYGVDIVQELIRCSGLCEICRRRFAPLGTQRQKGPRTELEPHVDHNHITMKVRGLLCTTCNLMVGYSKDSVHILQAGIEYLKRTDG